MSWPNEQDKARGLVATIRQMVNVKDSFTRIQQERDRERAERLRQQGEVHAQKQARREARASLRAKMIEAKNEPNAQRRGRLLEGLLAELCAVEGVQIREPFEIRNAGSPEEQIDGLITAGAHLYFVEVKWWRDPVEITAMSSHLIRLFRRPDARGLFVSVSGFTEPAISACRDVLSQKLMVLAELNELIFLLESDRGMGDWLERKAQMVVAERNPFYIVTDF
ncbi:hypothetical protein Prum_067490 [Phytohabitans rumicis]|uniref:Restriction endonuclease type IV Mrr domain-containing protein n=1 Tax=Phytohabitans rumicis TaxID=1076125 RepID=A0A6V8LGA3_9ACTN|nr:hypothetical protein Prum_067490 [Phytohabitans rumicis]